VGSDVATKGVPRVVVERSCFASGMVVADAAHTRPATQVHEEPANYVSSTVAASAVNVRNVTRARMADLFASAMGEGDVVHS
jgi:hypothetical protein